MVYGIYIYVLEKNIDVYHCISCIHAISLDGCVYESICTLRPHVVSTQQVPPSLPSASLT